MHGAKAGAVELGLPSRTLLDDTVLPPTSAHAVERGHRRHRKIPKRVYQIRSKVCCEGRMASDMIREARAEG